MACFKAASGVIRRFHVGLTEQVGVAVTSQRTGFYSRPGYRLSWLHFFVVWLSVCLGYCTSKWAARIT